MLFMSIFTFEPENREAVIKRRAEKGVSVPAGVKVVGEWTSLAGLRVFRVTETDDPRALYAASSVWLDLGKIEIFPVMPTEEIMKILTSKK